MARLSRVVPPKTPHHVTQRGNRRQTVFFDDDDYATYMGLIATFAAKADTRIWAYCLMPDHVHFVMVPQHSDGLRAALGETHRRYTRYVNGREDWRGHLWQERFHSFPMDKAHLLMAMRYIELKPVQAGLVDDPAAWPWSSAALHLGRQAKDPLVNASSAPKPVDDWASCLLDEPADHEVDLLERHLRTGRPLGADRFLNRLEKRLGRTLRPQRPGPKPKEK